jgi:hypothetical protein
MKLIDFAYSGKDGKSRGGKKDLVQKSGELMNSEGEDFDI